MSVHFSSKSNEWYTPKHVFDSLNARYNFTLDPCATDDNYKCDKYFTVDDDGLSKDWSNDIVFCNPPYGRDIGKWVEKSYVESKKGAVVVMLIPARTDTRYWHDFIFNKASEIIFIKGRLKFGGSNCSAPFPSAIVVFNESNETKFSTIEFKESK